MISSKLYSVKYINNIRSVVALQNIPKNTVLFEEKINLIVNRNDVNWYEQIIKYELMNNYEIFLDLEPTQCDKYTINDGIFNTNYKKITTKHTANDLTIFYNKIIRNAFSVVINNVNYCTILYTGRMLNHSCKPTVLFKFEKKDKGMYMIFYTCKDVKKECELTDNYFNIDLPFEKRQYISRTYYGFECKCSKCIKKE